MRSPIQHQAESAGLHTDLVQYISECNALIFLWTAMKQETRQTANHYASTAQNDGRPWQVPRSPEIRGELWLYMGVCAGVIFVVRC